MATKKSQGRKIGILGCALPTLALTPFDDPSWELWAHGQLQPGLKRFDCWFEIHDPAKMPPPFAQHIENMQKATHPVYGVRPTPLIPNLIPIDRERLLAKYGTEFMTSTVALMMAHAIEQDPKPAEIGLWGVEMSSEGEYYFQRPGCKFFQWVAEQAGIKVTIPPESDLARDRDPYPDGDESEFARWVVQRQGITQASRDQMQEQKHTLEIAISRFDGGLEIFEHIRRQQGW